MPLSPVLDFLATIHAKERLPGGAFAILDAAERERPGTVLRIDRAGAVWSLPPARATAARQALGR